MQDNTIKCVLVIVSILICVFASNKHNVANTMVPSHDEDPTLLFSRFHLAGRPKRQKAEGLEIAIWSDGVVLRSTTPGGPSAELEWARLNDADIELLKSDIKRFGLFERQNRAFVVPDAGYIKVIGAQDGVLASARWDEVIRRGWGMNAMPTEEYRDFANAWFQTMISVCSRNVSDVRPVTQSDQAASYRGYDWKNPFATKWIGVE